MKKFENRTIEGNEKIIKIGGKVQDDSIPLVWFHSEGVTPSNTLSVSDVSYLIPENVIGKAEKEIIAYADELGILRTIDGSSAFKTNDLTVSNIFINKQSYTERLNVETLEFNDFSHFYYMSRFFIAAPKEYSVHSVRQYIDIGSLIGLNILVTHPDGSDYINIEKSTKKYRILLEPFKTEYNIVNDLIPYRIIVLFDSEMPLNVRLTYDKVRCDDRGLIFDQQINYSETVNAVPIFKQKAEESFVLDKNYSISDTFSVKKLNQKHSEIINDTWNDDSYQVFVSSKSMEDNRNYEIFNWRLIAKSKSSVSLNDEDFPSNDTLTNYRTINVGVLYSSRFSSFVYDPYIFYRLENSPFNLSKFKFVNPFFESGSLPPKNIEQPLYSVELVAEKNQRNYWLVDIETQDLSKYDVLAFEPSFELNSDHISRLKSFAASSGALILDLSRTRIGIPEISGLGLSMDQTVSMSNHMLNNDAEIIDSTKNGGWSMAEVDGYTIFEKEEYSIHGTSKFDSGTYKNTKYFSSYSSSSEFDRYNYFITHNSEPTGIHLIGKGVGDRLVGGNIFATAFPFFRYCNDSFSITGSDNTITSNNDAISLDDGSGNLFSAVIEGPFKALYNMICYSLYSRMAIKGSRVDFRSPLYNYVSDWRSGWVMDTEALLEEEKAKYFTTIPISPSKSVSSLEILKNEKVNSDIINFYKNEISNFLTEKQKSRLSSVDVSDIDFYIEITNPDVKLYNSSTLQRVDNNSINGLSSSYYLYKIQDSLKKVFAYTLASSPELYVPDNLGPYIIMEKPISTSGTRLINDNIDRNSAFKDYNFNIHSYYNYFSAKDSPQSYTVYTDLVGTARLNRIQHVTTRLVVPEPVPAPEPVITEDSVKTYSTFPCEGGTSAIDQGLLRATSSSQPNNTFEYTGDIDRGNTWKQWVSSPSSSGHTNRGVYATYIQYTLKVYNDFYSGQRNYYPYELDDYYGPATASGVRSFQSSENQRYKDGTVDSETKAYLSKFWKRVRSQNRALYDASLAQAPSGVSSFITSAVGASSLKRTTFSGFAGPSESQDVFVFKLPQNVNGVEKITIEVDQSWADCRVVSYGTSSTYSGALQMPGAVSVNSQQVGGVITINVGEINPTTGVYVWVDIRGSSIVKSGHGYAEGFSIRSFKCYGYTWTTVGGEPIPVPVPQEPVWETVIEYKTGVLNFKVKNYPKIVDPSNVITHSFSSAQSFNDLVLQSSEAYVESVKLDGYTFTFGGRNYSLKDIIIDGDSEIYVDGSYTFSFRSSNISSPKINEFEVVKVVNNDTNITVWDSDQDESLNPVSVDSVSSLDVSSTESTLVPEDPRKRKKKTESYNGGVILRYQTSSTYYSDSQVVRIGPVSMPSDYSLMTVDGVIVYGAGKSSVNIHDGVLLLCDNFGNPVGFPPSSLINAGLNNISSSLEDEIDTRFGLFSIVNFELLEQGFIYGFYDLNEKEFIGTTISYVELLQRNVNGNNIYIGVLAYDADGNTGNIDFLGPSKDMTFTPTVVPLKYIAPVYSVSLNAESAIRVGNLYNSLSKFDAWELPVSSGSFSKLIKIPNNYFINDWKKNFIGKETLAFYETSRSKMSEWSGIYGYGSYDVTNESPVILDNEKIRLRNTPILSWNYPTNHSESIFGIIKPIVNIYFRDKDTGSWDLVPQSYIRNIDCFNGIIEFKPRVMPSFADDIKVNYSVKNKDILIREINGSPIPINPFLNTVDYKRPLFIYLLPEKVYALDGLSKKYVLIDDYEKSNSVNYTYDSNIFNKNSITYDPFALPIAVISIKGNLKNKIPNYTDVRTRGGGLKDDVSIAELMQYDSSVLNNWDVYPPSTISYPNGGYVIVRIPREVENNFLDKNEVYDIIRSNLTAGVVFELQDLEGNSWS